MRRSVPHDKVREKVKMNMIKLKKEFDSLRKKALKLVYQAMLNNDELSEELDEIYDWRQSWSRDIAYEQRCENENVCDYMHYLIAMLGYNINTACYSNKYNKYDKYRLHKLVDAYDRSRWQ